MLFTKKHSYSYAIILILIILDIVFLWRIYKYDDFPLYKTAKHRVFNNINFDSHSSDSALSEVKEFSEKDSSDLKEVTIKFRTKVNAVTYYNNIFQTAPKDKGIRMELTKPTSIGLVVGYNNPEGFRGFPLSDSLEFNKWYSMEISIDSGKHLQVKIDDAPLLDITDNNISYDISQIAVGRGYNQERKFDGTISNFSIEYRLMKPSPMHLFIRIIPWLFLSIIYIKFVNNKLLIFLNRYLKTAIIFIKLANKKLLILSNRHSKTMIFYFIVFNLTLLFLIPVYRLLSVIYVCLFILGFPLYLFLTPGYLNKKYLIGFLPCLYGLVEISLIGFYFISFSLPVNYFMAIPFILTVLLFLAAYRLIRTQLFSSIKIIANTLRSGSSIVTFSSVILLSLTVLYPMIKIGYPTTVYRIGPDQPLYVETARYLLEGGTMEQIKKTASDIINPSSSILHGNLLVFMRWSVPANIVYFTRLMFSRHPYEISFIILIFSCLLTAVFTYYILTEILRVPKKLSYLGAAALALNCNLLNVYYESQSAQQFASPLFLLLIIIFLQLRSHNRNLIKSGLLIGLLSATLLVTYPDISYLVLILIILTTLFDLVIYLRIKIRLLFIFISSFLLGWILIFPENAGISKIIINTFNTVKTSYAGYPQPHWALPSEIIGLSNIYQNYQSWTDNFLGIKEIPRSPFELTVNIIASIMISLALAINYLKNKKIDKSFWLFPFVIVLIIYFRLSSQHQHNYSYMKMYTILLPFIFAFCLSSLNQIYRRTKILLLKNIVNSITYLFLFIIIFTGSAYLSEYKNTEKYITKDMFQLYDYYKNHQLDDSILLPKERGKYQLNRMADRLDEGMLIPLLPINTIDQWVLSGVHINNDNASKKVLLLVDKKDFACPLVNLNQNTETLYENNSYLILDTKEQLQDALVGKEDKINLNVYWSLYPACDTDYFTGKNKLKPPEE